MRIVVFSPNLPYPPNRGGKADIWRRILAFRQLGHEVMLVCLMETVGQEASTMADCAAVDAVVTRRFSFPIKRSLMTTVKQLANSFFVPWHASTRVPSKAEMSALTLMLAAFKADFVWLDGPWFGVVGVAQAKRLDIPILYRSHNVEYQYILGQAKAAVSLRDRVAWTLACIGLKRFEEATMRRAVAAFDISVDDLQFWEASGMQQMHWLPPLPELAFKTRTVKPIQTDIVFLGNLGTPNNVRGVEWLVTEILPLVLKQMPNARCRIVGSTPTSFISDLLVNAVGAELCADVPDPTPYLFGAKVLVNPVMTGSGVQVKMLDMLMTDAPIVTASQGTRGLPNDFRGLFRVADDADAFARAICEELAMPSVDLKARAAAREVFSVEAVAKALELAGPRGGSDTHA